MQTHVPLAAWIAFNLYVVAMLALDLGVWHREARVIPPREAALWTGFWVLSALVFAGGLAVWLGAPTGLTFLTGYVIEESLSADNVFVMAAIFAYLQIPLQYQHRVLFWGILGALVMRGAFIGAGAYLFAHFTWTNYVMGAILLVAAARMALRHDAPVDNAGSAVVRFLRRFLPVSSTLDGQRLVTREGVRWVATPLLVALVMIELSDVAFATDSIPAVFSVTHNPFIVYTSNVFALFGLRSLYFLIAAAAVRYRYLPYGLAAVLAFTGLEMVFERVVAVPTGVSLAVIAGILAAAVGVSIRSGPGEKPKTESRK
jgi:tellurite resistance protein TerC